MSKGKHNTRSQAPEYLASLITYTTCELVKNGIDKENAERIAHDVSKQMCEQWGGQIIYFPYWMRMELSARDRKIYEEFNGHNHADLCRRHEISLQSIYRIIKFVKEEETARRQAQLDL
jgi:Mor family transcriptional regulator